MKIDYTDSKKAVKFGNLKKKKKKRFSHVNPSSTDWVILVRFLHFEEEHLSLDFHTIYLMKYKYMFQSVLILEAYKKKYTMYVLGPNGLYLS